MLYLIVIEPIETRYTCEWYEFLPKLLSDNGIETTIIEGSKREYKTSTGAFLDFSATNIYKSEQVIQIAELFSAGKIKNGDTFLFLDAWHPGVINLKYMIELNHVDAKIGAIWHAGSYDPYDFLGYSITDKTWVSHTEKAYFNAIDYNFFATNFHIDLIKENLLNDMKVEYVDDKFEYCGKVRDSNSLSMISRDYNNIIRTGFPFEYMEDLFKKYREIPKEDIIVFPHRKAQEKQLDIFLDLEKTLPQYKFIVCADHNFTKQQYRDLLGKSKLVFSANLQETLGISCYEILAANGMCLVPDRLSYVEMYKGDILYPEEWTPSFETYVTHKDKLLELITDTMDNFYGLHSQATIIENRNFLSENYFSAGKMIDVLKNGNK